MKQKNRQKQKKERMDPFDVEMFFNVLLGIMVIWLMVMVIILFFRLVAKDSPIGWEPDYGDHYETDGNPDADPARLNIAVLPDYTVSPDSPYILIPYPADNANDITFTFRDKTDSIPLYTTKRVRPGTVVRVNPYAFCRAGDNEICVDVRVYNGRHPLNSSITLETTIRKEGRQS